jgi:hypothetical protein
VNLSKISKDTNRAGGEKDWFHLLLEIEHRFRAEERKKRRSESEITPKLTNAPFVTGQTKDSGPAP